MNRLIKIIFLLCGALLVLGCGYKAYLGLHGASIKLHPDIHRTVTEDRECLECHHPDNPKGPPTPHPNFKGCIKCHNDENGSNK